MEQNVVLSLLVCKWCSIVQVIIILFLTEIVNDDALN